MPTAPYIACVVPVYGHWPYALSCVASLEDTTPGVSVIVVDDASPEPPPGSWLESFQSNPAHRYGRFASNQGLTAAWNEGMRVAFSLGAEYIVAGNSDLLFAPRWYEALVRGAEHYSLLGPLSNAPGVTANGMQEVQRHVPDYAVSDDPGELRRVGEFLAGRHLNNFAEGCSVNGFCLFARSEAWRRGSFDGDHVFRPRNERMPSGRVNPTPTMTGNEDELQHRWAKLNMPSAVALGSYVFHYRSVTRGPRYSKGLWMRMAS